jgi:hypothetical protein
MVLLLRINLHENDTAPFGSGSVLVPFDRFEVPSHMERGPLLLKFRFRVEFFHFRISA